MPHPMAHLSCFCNHLLRTGGKSLLGPRCRVRRSVELTDWFCETAWDRFAADRGLIGSLCAQPVPEKARLAQEAGAKKLEESTVSNPDRAALPAATAPHRSSAEPSLLIPLADPPGSVISNWQRGVPSSLLTIRWRVNGTIPEDRQNHDYRHTAPLRTHATPLVRQQVVERASVSQCDIDDFELERRQPNAITTDAIQRAFEGVGVVFLPQDDVQLRSDVSPAR